MKRLFDIVVASASIVILSPLIAATAALIAWRLGRPVLFRQVRPGLGGKPFELVKFRTMRPFSERHRTDAERLTPLGRFLRSSSLDELPELWNVLKGEMSLVGPRPLLMEYIPLYSERQARRHEVRPGLTGWAQINGRNALSWTDKFELDVWYVDHRSFWLDIRILWRTLIAVLKRDGIGEESGAGQKRFEGESVADAEN